MKINQKIKKNKLSENKRDQELRVYSLFQWRKKNSQKKKDKIRKKKELILIK